MPQLVETADWTSDSVKSRINFFRLCAERYNELSVRLGPLALAPEELKAGAIKGIDPRREAGLAARMLTYAAEIALAVGNTQQGIGLIGEAILRLLPKVTLGGAPFPGTLEQFVMACVFCALTDKASVHVSPQRGFIRNSMPSAVFNWDRVSSPQVLARILPLVLTAMAISTSPEEVAELLTAPELEPHFAIALTAASTQPQFATLGLQRAIYQSEAVKRQFSQLNRRDGYAALREMERSYSLRIELLRKDVHHWKSLRFRAELIDWQLLVTHVALLRTGARKLTVTPEQGDLGATDFSWALAAEFARLQR